MKAVERWKDEMPIEQEMVPKDKYTIFDRKEKKYRKSIRSTFLQPGTLPDDILTFLQSCPNGRGFRNESILQDTDRTALERMYHIPVYKQTWAAFGECCIS